ncbi:MAG: prolipoprotein diacylglyceryl transferase [Acidimicrobiia bacterium]|nr:prolipoprotein diacylglyceryl transferase [Acidimicrobiia bacterium]
MDFSLVGAAAIGLAGVYAVLWWEAGRGNAADCTRRLWDLLLGSAIAGLVVGRLVAMIRAGTNPLTHPGDILIIRGGVDTGAAAVAALAVAAFHARKDLLPTLDAAAPAALAGLAGWQAGCLARGSCLGTPTGLPWGMHLGGSDVGRHPVEVYAALLLAIGVIALIAWKRRHPSAGMVTGIAVAWAGTARLVTEPMRVGIGAGPEWWYAAGIVAAVGFTAWSYLRSRRAVDQP